MLLRRRQHRNYASSSSDLPSPFQSVILRLFHDTDTLPSVIHSPPRSPCRPALHPFFPSGSLFHTLGVIRKAVRATAPFNLHTGTPIPAKTLATHTSHHSTLGFAGIPTHGQLLGTWRGPFIWWIRAIKRMSSSQTWLPQILRSRQLASHRADGGTPPCRGSAGYVFCYKRSFDHCLLPLGREKWVGWRQVRELRPSVSWL